MAWSRAPRRWASDTRSCTFDVGDAGSAPTTFSGASVPPVVTGVHGGSSAITGRSRRFRGCGCVSRIDMPNVW